MIMGGGGGKRAITAAVENGDAGPRQLPQEVAVAMVCQGGSQAVMMCSPQDLEDFAIGFCLSEGIVAAPDEIETLEVVEHPNGLEVQMWLRADRAAALGARRRTMAGAVGCGMCGLESLDQAARVLPQIPHRARGLRVPASELRGALDALRHHQPLHDLSRGMHAAGFWVPGDGIALAREDIGRHNALDKLIGALARADVDLCSGAAVLTSRVSVDMVQKCAMAGIPVVIAAGAPTDLAMRNAKEVGMTLVTSARRDGFDLWPDGARVIEEHENVC